MAYLATGNSNDGLMGITPPALPAQQPPAPQQDQQSQEQAKPYNGTITFQGKTAEVKNGVITGKDGRKFIVANDGHFVVDAQTRQLVGKVEDGKFVPTDAAHVADMQKRGAIEQPQSAPQQASPPMGAPAPMQQGAK